MSRLLLLSLFLGLLPTLAHAARMPDKVERMFTITGPKAQELADFLGLPSNHDGTYRLPWAKSTATCFKEMGPDGPIYHLCDPTERFNTISYIASNPARIVFAGQWYDGETGSVPDVPKYSFSSPPLNTGENVADWKFLDTKLRERILATEQKRVRFSEDSTPLVQVSLERVEGKPRLTLSFDERPLSARKSAEQKYDECIERQRKNPRDGGC